MKKNLPKVEDNRNNIETITLLIFYTSLYIIPGEILYCSYLYFKVDNYVFSLSLYETGRNTNESEWWIPAAADRLMNSHRSLKVFRAEPDRCEDDSVVIHTHTV